MAQKSVNLCEYVEPEVKEQAEKQPDLSLLSEIELSKELEKGYADMQAGRTDPVGEVFANIRKDYSV